MNESARSRRALARAARDPEAGDTLIEILITLVVLGITTAALLGAFVTSMSASSRDKGLATIGTVLKSFAATATYAVQLQPSPLYVSCATTYALGTTYTPPSGYTVSITSIQYWNNTLFSSTCAPGSTAPQLILATATGPVSTSDTLSFVVTDPDFAGAGAANQSAPVVTSAASDRVSSGVTFTFPVTASGNPAPTLSATGMPSGVTFVNSGGGSGSLGGSSTVAGTYAITIVASNGVGTPVTQAFSLTVT